MESTDKGKMSKSMWDFSSTTNASMSRVSEILQSSSWNVVKLPWCGARTVSKTMALEKRILGLKENIAKEALLMVILCQVFILTVEMMLCQRSKWTAGSSSLLEKQDEDQLQ